jgi:hypothetical protein
MFGQYGGFDDHKYDKDFRDGFYGIEACSFHTHEDYLKLIEESKNRGFHIGVHFPLRAKLLIDRSTRLNIVPLSKTLILDDMPHPFICRTSKSTIPFKIDINQYYVS